MLTRFLVALCLCGVASTAMGYATYAYFSDTATIDDTQFLSGTVDLATSDPAAFKAALGSNTFAPGDTRSGTLTLTNAGTLKAASGHNIVLDWKMAVTQTDALGGTTNLANFIQVTTLSYAGDNYLSAADGGVAITDSNSNGWIDLMDVVARGPYTAKADPGASGSPLAMSVLFRGEATNALQGDSADIDFTFFLRQSQEPALV